MIKKGLFLSFVAILSVEASTLEVYQNFTTYSFEPKDSFIGFVQNASATCGDEDIDLIYKLDCNNDSTMCKTYKNLESLNQDLSRVDTNLQTIDTLLSIRDKNSLSAKELLQSAEIIATKKSELTSKSSKLKEQILLTSNQFKAITTSYKPLYLENKCDKELKLKIPYGYVSAKPIYEANIDDDRVTITQKLEITNRSGVDIKADIAKFYYYSLNEYVNPVSFNAWVVSEYHQERLLQKRLLKEKKSSYGSNMALAKSKVADSEALDMPKPIGKYSDAREYTVENLDLPSSKKSLKVKILEYKSDLECSLKAYPYRDTRAFVACSFKPKYQIDSNRWLIKEDDKLINKNATGRYEKGKYTLYTKYDKDIVIKRERVVSKERESGIFGGTKRQKDGYKLIITNKSKEGKKIQIIDRVPISNTDKIKAKLLSLKPNVDYKLLKDGKLEINLELKPKESKEVEVLFEISYDKDLKVRY